MEQLDLCLDVRPAERTLREAGTAVVACLVAAAEGDASDALHAEGAHVGFPRDLLGSLLQRFLYRSIANNAAGGLERGVQGPQLRQRARRQCCGVPAQLQPLQRQCGILDLQHKTPRSAPQHE